MDGIFGCVKRNFHPGAATLLMLAAQAITGGAAWAQSDGTITANTPNLGVQSANSIAAAAQGGGAGAAQGVMRPQVCE
ncbi:MAG: hypothetical protein FWC42_10815 [Proteobacteria bacterium]|nr:hypothetical protein [Pseudomonadota bacterium]